MKIIQGEIENLRDSIEKLNHPEKNQVISELIFLHEKSLEESITREIVDKLNQISKQCKTLIEQENQLNKIINNLKQKEDKLINEFIIAVHENSNLSQNIEVQTIIEQINLGNIEPLKVFISSGKLQHYKKYNAKIQKLLEKVTKAENKLTNTNPSEILVETEYSTFKIEDFIQTQISFSRDNSEKNTTIQKSTPNKISNFFSSKFKWLAGLVLSISASTFIFENTEESKLSSNKTSTQVQDTRNFDRSVFKTKPKLSSIKTENLESIQMGKNPNSTNETNITKGLHQIALETDQKRVKIQCEKEFFEKVRPTSGILKDLNQFLLPATTPFRLDTQLDAREGNPLFLLKEQIFWELNNFKSIGDTVCLINHENNKTNLEEIKVVDALTSPKYLNYQWSTIALQKNSDTNYEGLEGNQIKTLILNLLRTQETMNKVYHIDNTNNLMKQIIRNANSTDEILYHPNLIDTIKSLLPTTYNLDVVVSNFEYNNDNSVSFIRNQQNSITAKIIMTFYNCPKNDNDIIIEVIAADPKTKIR